MRVTGGRDVRAAGIGRERMAGMAGTRLGANGSSARVEGVEARKAQFHLCDRPGRRQVLVSSHWIGGLRWFTVQIMLSWGTVRQRRFKFQPIDVPPW